MRPSRGAALPETALVLGVALTLMFGTFELGLIGYTQLASDGSAYVAAHAAVLGNDPVAAVAAPFPQIPAGSVSVAQNAPSTTDVPVDYNQTATTNRHGGLQVVRPMQLQATVNTAGVGVANALVPLSADLSSAAIEGRMMVNGPSFDIGATSLNSAAGYASAKSYFQDDGNAPPYFVGFRSFVDCTAVSFGSGCTATQMHAVAQAEYLDGDNWARGTNGIGPGGVYAEMLLHQTTYAKIAQALPAHISAAQRLIPGETGNASDPVQDRLDRCLATVQGWDVQVPAGATVTQYNLYPLTPGEDAYGC